MTHSNEPLRYGVAYYHEYHSQERLDIDLDLMVEAGINTIRVGESVWTTWEPRDGEFTLEWLRPILDGALERGIGVIIGTPTYAVPPWLEVAHPEIAAEPRTGQKAPWGARQELDYSHPTFRKYSERVIRAIMGRYAQHPAVIGYQVDNEPGPILSHSQHVFDAFVEQLRQQYGTVDNLNKQWGLVYWAHELDDWSELWRPDGNCSPQYDLAWREFQAGITTDFIGWQADIVREYARDDQFVTTCICYPQPALDDEKLGQRLSATAGNPYYGMQDRLDILKELPSLSTWTTSGVPGLMRQADRLYSTRQERFLVTETNAQSMGGPDENFPPYPGQLAQAAFSLVSRGAELVEYWHWHTIPYGCETYWGGVLPHSLKPGRVYREVASIGQRFAQLAPYMDNFDPDADIAILWSTASRFAMDFLAPIPDRERPMQKAYERIFDAFHSGIISSGRQARVLHVDQIVALGAAEAVRRFPVLVAAAVYATDAENIAFLEQYATQGGHLIIGPRTATADPLGRVHIATQPAGLVEAAGAWYEEFSNIEGKMEVVSTSASFPLAHGGAGQGLADGLLIGDPDAADDGDGGAEILATYDHPRFKDFAAVATHQHGAGRVTTVGTLPDRALAAAIYEYAVPRARAADLLVDAALPLTVSSGLAGSGERAWFVFNWGWEPQSAVLATDATEVGGERLAARSSLELGPWGVRVLISDRAD